MSHTHTHTHTHVCVWMLHTLNEWRSINVVGTRNSDVEIISDHCNNVTSPPSYTAVTAAPATAAYKQYTHLYCTQTHTDRQTDRQTDRETYGDDRPRRRRRQWVVWWWGVFSWLASNVHHCFVQLNDANTASNMTCQHQQLGKLCWVVIKYARNISGQNKKLCYCWGTARGTCQILQLQNISLEN